MSFLTEIEAQAKAETERVIKELTQLKFDAQQVIHVLNALKLEVPKELRELSPIEVIPAIKGVPFSVVTGTPPLDQLFDTPKEKRQSRGRKGREAGIKTRQVKAAKREEEIRKAITDQLSKGPVLGGKVIDNIPHTNSKISYVAAQMRKEGLLDYRVVGFQGPTEWFLPSRPITLETLRDEVVKTQGIVPLAELLTKFGFARALDLRVMMEELVDIGIVKQGTDGFLYEKPKGPVIKAIPASRRGKNFGGGVNGVSGDKISSNKEVRELIAKARNQGAVIKKTDKHIAVSFAGHTTTISGTPNASGLKQDRNRLKMMGLRV